MEHGNTKKIIVEYKNKVENELVTNFFCNVNCNTEWPKIYAPDDYYTETWHNLTVRQATASAMGKLDSH
jgi:hypothetical protein